MKHFIIRTLIICAVAAPIYLLLRQPWKYEDKKREVLLALFAVYMTCLLMLTLRGDYASPRQMLQSFIDRTKSMYAINIVPFNSICGFMEWGSTDDVWVNIISNILIFVPFGFLLPSLWKKFRKPYVLLPICLGLTVLIEIWQLFINRHTDIDDVILNFIGGTIGAIAFYAANRIKNKKGCRN